MAFHEQHTDEMMEYKHRHQQKELLLLLWYCKSISFKSFVHFSLVKAQVGRRREAKSFVYHIILSAVVIVFIPFEWFKWKMQCLSPSVLMKNNSSMVIQAQVDGVASYYERKIARGWLSYWMGIFIIKFMRNFYSIHADA